MKTKSVRNEKVPEDIQVHTLSFNDLARETVKQSIRLQEYFRLNLIYYQLVSGKGLEFDKLKEYEPGNDLRRMDWKKFAKTQRLLIRAFKEERKFDVVIVLDVSDSMLLGTSQYTKNEFASILAGALGFAAVDAGDSIAVVMNSDKNHVAIDPTNDYFSMLSLISNPENYGGKKDWNALQRLLLANYASDAIIFVISDFIDTNPDQFLPELASSFTKVYGIMIRDPIDNTLPKGVGKAYLKDPKTGEMFLADLNSSRKEYETLNKHHMKFVATKFEENGQLFFSMTTDEDFGFAFIKALGSSEVVIS